jgi:hypothetical protein
MGRRRRGTGDERDAWLPSQLELLADECAAVERALQGKASRVTRRLQEEARIARGDAVAALEKVEGAEKQRLLRSALYATRQVERILKDLHRRSLLPPDLTPTTFDRIIALRMDFLRRLLRPD